MTPFTSMKSSPVCRTIQINGKQHYLWRAVDQDGEVVDVYLQAKRDGAAAKRFFRRLLRSHGSEPRKIVTDILRSCGVAHRDLISETIHSTKQYENNRAEQSHEAIKVRERGMRRFKSLGQAQRFVTAHVANGRSIQSREAIGGRNSFSGSQVRCVHRMEKGGCLKTRVILRQPRKVIWCVPGNIIAFHIQELDVEAAPCNPLEYRSLLSV